MPLSRRDFVVGILRGILGVVSFLLLLLLFLFFLFLATASAIGGGTVKAAPIIPTIRILLAVPFRLVFIRIIAIVAIVPTVPTIDIIIPISSSSPSPPCSHRSRCSESAAGVRYGALLRPHHTAVTCQVSRILHF
jgi:hypothetical protein